MEGLQAKFRLKLWEEGKLGGLKCTFFFYLRETAKFL